jgi:hypothetical protein
MAPHTRFLTVPIALNNNDLDPHSYIVRDSALVVRDNYYKRHPDERRKAIS